VTRQLVAACLPVLNVRTPEQEDTYQSMGSVGAYPSHQGGWAAACTRILLLAAGCIWGSHTPPVKKRIE
jgi:hypothetical protein